MKRLNSCCCCFSVRTGAVVIAAFGIIFSLIGIVGNSADLSKDTSKLELQRWDEEAKKEMTGDTYKLYHIFIEALISWREAVLEVTIAFGVFDLLTSFLVVVGVAHRKHSYLAPWLVFEVIYTVVSAITYLALVAVVSKWSGGLAFGVFFVTAIWVLLWSYLIWVVKSEYDNIKGEEQSGKSVQLA